MKGFRTLIILWCISPAIHAQTWTLDSCITYAFSHNITLKRTELNVVLANENNKAAWGAMLPSLNGQATHGYNWGQRIDPFTNQFATERVQSNNFGLSTSVNLFSGFQQLNTWKQAQINIEASQWNYEAIRNDIALNVATAYLNVLLTLELSGIAEKNAAQSLAQYERLLILFHNGQIARGELDQMETQYAMDSASVVSANNNYRLALLSLMQLLQLSQEQMNTFDIVVPDMSAFESLQIISNPQVAVDYAVRNFPQIKSAEYNVESAVLGERIAQGSRLPSLNASFSYGTGYSGASKVITGTADSLEIPIGTVAGTGIPVVSFPQAVYGLDDYSTKPFNDQLTDNRNQALFFSLTVPIFNGFRTSTAIQRARINTMDAELQLEQSKLQLSQDVQRAHADALAAFANYNSAGASVEAGERAFEWATLRFEQGLMNFVDFSAARLTLDAARSTQLLNKYEFVFKVKVLEFYQGKPISIK